MAVTVGDVNRAWHVGRVLMATTQLLVRNTLVAWPIRVVVLVTDIVRAVFNGAVFHDGAAAAGSAALIGMQISIAGHPAPLIATGDSIQYLTNPAGATTGVGVDRDAKYVTETYKLPPQASLLLYTDAWWNARTRTSIDSAMHVCGRFYRANPVARRNASARGESGR